MKKSKGPAAEILCYSPTPASRSRVRRCYAGWRQQQALPARCDNPACTFHTQKLEWNGKTWPLILDHINGNRFDNRPENLQYVCPNCDAQLPTRGGANKGRVAEVQDGSYVLLSKDGRRYTNIFPKGGQLIATGHAPAVNGPSNQS